jgi:MFS family permease
VKENTVAIPGKFNGWKQVFLVAIVVGAAGNLHFSALTITNAAMLSGGTLVVSGTMYGLAYSLFSLMQGPPQPFVAALTKRIGPRKALMMGCLLSAVLCLGLSNIINSAIVFVLFYDATGGYSGAFFLYGALVLMSAAIFVFFVGIPCTRNYKKAMDLAA